MEEVHALNHHGRYSWADIMQMTGKERLWLLTRIKKQFDQEARNQTEKFS